MSTSLQRLFSTFANGWPGLGLLVQRVLTGSILIHAGVFPLLKSSHATIGVPETIGSAGGILLLVGMWTPAAGTLVAVVEMWAIFIGAPEPWFSAMMATMGATLAMIGPGAWSVDARIFGRKHIETGDY